MAAPPQGLAPRRIHPGEQQGQRNTGIGAGGKSVDRRGHRAMRHRLDRPGFERDGRTRQAPKAEALGARDRREDRGKHACRGCVNMHDRISRIDDDPDYTAISARSASRETPRARRSRRVSARSRLAKRFPSGPSSKGMVAIRWCRQIEQRLQQPLDVGRLEEVGAADHVGDPLQRVVDDHGQMVGDPDILASQDDVAGELGRCAHHTGAVVAEGELSETAQAPLGFGERQSPRVRQPPARSAPLPATAPAARRGRGSPAHGVRGRSHRAPVRGS